MPGSGILIIMRVLLSVLILTFVVNLFASPHLDAPTKVAGPDEETVIVDPERLENISIVEPRPMTPSRALVERFDKADYFYPYRSDFSMHAGVVFGVKDSSDDDDLMNVLLGFGYTVPKLDSPKWHLGADLSMVGDGHFYVSRRFIYNEKGSFRPFYQYGVLHKMVPDEKFASFSNWDNYLLRAGVGLSDIVRPPRSVEIELNVAIGAKDILVMFTYGYSWGF